MFCNPKKNIQEMNIGEGMKVADFGTGGGAHILPMLERVAEYGEVFAIDLQAPKLSRVLNQANRLGYKNLSIIHADLETKTGSHLKDRSVDRVTMTNFLHFINDKPAVFREAARILKKNGRLIIIDWKSSHGMIGPHPSLILTPDWAEKIAKRAGFDLERQFESGDHHYGMVFKLSKI
jgi:ubiquinone/menaquinone biosynthesis C-methylase UbiE